MGKSNSDSNCRILTISNSPELKVWYQPASSSPKGCIIFVHGICHGAWCFEHFMDFFSENGYTCFALNLRGHGDNNRDELKNARLSDYAKDVKRCVGLCKKYCRKEGIDERPFLLGHSMGGAVVQKYIGTYEDTVKGAILFASATAKRMGRCKMILDLVTKKNMKIAVRKSFGYQVSDKDLYKSAFFDCRIVPKEEIKKYNMLLHKEPWMITVWDLFKKYSKNYDLSIPMLVIGSEEDSFFGKNSLKKTARIYGCTKTDNKKQLIILPDLCHDMMLDRDWEVSAKKVLEFMENNK